MIRVSAKSVWTFLITGATFIMLPILVFFSFRFFMARLITQDNAGIIFDQFQEKLDHGALIRDASMAEDAADHGYRDKTHGLPLDGWGVPFRIHASVQDTRCTLTIQSAGPDGAFGTADDVALQRGFDLSKPKLSATSHP